ncbi:MAG: isocitrate/isopropylmalate dehydrogenase family protein [Proteobacteria bacterium]|nr:isocitrate/isopropylmalate dehydrogenase family protein [Pseudomonadota bacterium]MCP4916525.1 isocitrate/isopropylmalate dehydrogenase family protein [Pseudomonadota bacterium]
MTELPTEFPPGAHEVTLMPGSWIGPACTDVVRELIADVGVDIVWDVFEGPEAASDAAIESARRTGVVLKNRVRSSRTEGQLPVSVHLRKSLGLWAQLRHVKNLPGVPARFSGVDILVVRETSEDIYNGFEHQTAPGVYESVKLTTRAGCERIAVKAFELAREQGRKKVTIVHKSNIMKKSDGLFLKTAQEVAARYPDVACDEVIVDALCMKLVRWPTSFDVLLCGNLFGDIVSDLAAGLAGGISVGGSVNQGDDVIMFENPHGKAPELVGTGKANPIPMLVMAVDLLRHLGEEAAAERLSVAYHAALEGGLSTVDIGGDAGLVEVREAIRSHL